jgi:phospholipid/cholesterol/gamma-HCH transport system substrate-binding protein
MGSTREKTLVGLFVLVAAALLFGGVLALNGGIGTSRTPLHTHLKFSGGLDAGGAVRYGGLSVGKITKVRVDPADSTRILVDFVVDSNTPVRTDSIARVSSLGLLSDSFLEISPGTNAAPLVARDAEVRSKESMNIDQVSDALGAALPDAQKALKSLNTDLETLQVTLDRANDLLNDQNRAHIASTLSTLDKTLIALRPELNKTVKQLDDILADAGPKVSSSLTDVQALAKKLDPLVDNLNKAVKTADETLSHVDATLGENRADIRASVASLRKALDQANALLTQANAELANNSDNIDESLENIRLATENLRQLTDELKTSPSSIIRGTGAKDRKPGGSVK